VKGRSARIFFTLAALGVSTFLALVFFPLQYKEKDFIVNSELSKDLICSDPLYAVLGRMFITSPDKGKSLNVSVDRKNFLLIYVGSRIAEDVYENKTGQRLQFDGEITHSGFFGDEGGHCS
jgi:hypothetical protein